MISDFLICEVDSEVQIEVSINDIKELDESDIAVTGIDFFTNESITCKIKFYETSDLFTALVGNNDTIPDTQFLKKYFSFNKNGEARKYYIDKNKIKWDMKAKEISVTAEDLSGIVFDLIDVDQSFSTSNFNPVTKTEELIENKLTDSVLQNDLFDVTDNTKELSLSNYEFHNPSAEIDFDGTNPLDGSCVKDLDAYGGTIRWKWIGINEGNLRLYFYYLKVYEVQPNYYEYDKVLLKYDIIDNIVLDPIYESVEYMESYSGTYSYLDEIDGLDTDDCQLTYNNYEITTHNLTWSGTTKITQVNLSSGDDYNVKGIIKKLCYMNNVAIISDRNTTLTLETRFNETAEITNVSDNEVIEFETENINWGDIDWSSEFSDFADSGQLAEIMVALYRYLRNSMTVKVKMKIMNEHSLSILDRINVYDNDYTIIGINIDNDNQMYEVEAWR